METDRDKWLESLLRLSFRTPVILDNGVIKVNGVDYGYSGYPYTDDSIISVLMDNE